MADMSAGTYSAVCPPVSLHTAWPVPPSPRKLSVDHLAHWDTHKPPLHGMDGPGAFEGTMWKLPVSGSEYELDKEHSALSGVDGVCGGQALAELAEQT